jgi:hypothetical protein
LIKINQKLDEENMEEFKAVVVLDELRENDIQI